MLIAQYLLALSASYNEEFVLHSNTLSALSSCTSGESDSYFRFGDTCYVISGDQCTWFVARMRCHAKGGDLVRIRSRDEFDLLVSQLIALKYWIGLRALPWIWSDGNYRASSCTLTSWKTT